MSTLVAQQTSTTSLTTTATTLMDWFNVEDYSDFRIVVENSGGGSAGTIDDVLIDESSDGGTTITLDQHAGVPTVPISAGDSAQKSFTSTAKWLRVRATSATDTTSIAWMMADTFSGGLCLLQDVRDRVGTETSNTTDDAAIQDMIRGVSGQFDTYADRIFLLNSSDATETFSSFGRYLSVPRFPIVSVTSVKEASDYDFSSATSLTVNDAYRVVNDKGYIYRLAASWSSGPDENQVVYKGGYVGPGATVSAGETALPNDIREAAIMQVQFVLNRRGDVGLTAVSSTGMSITKFSAMDLLPLVKKTLNMYRRKGF